MVSHMFLKQRMQISMAVGFNYIFSKVLGICLFMKVLVIAGCGFVGSHIAERLLDDGFE